VPEIPELSAVVLSQGIGENEDGYLRAREIAGLDIEADFACLSACDTGLGKIYGGEGIVGLTQSFMIAGANGLCVSLWKVDDEATRKFMIEMYRMAVQEKKGYARAIAETKRKFIAGEFGEQYKDPYYWAPFAYYGVP
jgi:CHAT domain-containing protein